MTDEEGENELKVKHSVILDPYVLVIRHDDSCIILKADRKGELDEIEPGETLRTTTWTSGSLHTAPNDDNTILAYLLSTDGTIKVSQRSSSSKHRVLIQCEGFPPAEAGRACLYS